MAPPVWWIDPAGDGRSGGSLYNRRVSEALAARGEPPRRVGVAPPWSGSAAALAAPPDGARVVVDGLLIAPLAPAFAALCDRCLVLAVVHLPAFREGGLSARRRAALAATEGEALRRAARVMTTSGAAADDVSEAFGIPRRDRKSVV